LVLDEPQDNETVIPVNGINFLIEEGVNGFAERGRIDFLKEPYGERFTIGMTGFSGC
jgi:hypothetical protein